jgi:hypothetical protein
MVTGLDWDAFAAALVEELPALGEGDTVILSHGDAYVQFSQAPAVLYADTSGGDRERLGALGWQAPNPALGAVNWWVKVPWPLRTQDSATLVDLLVRTLREVHGAAGPDALAYRAFNSRTGAQLDIPALRQLKTSSLSNRDAHGM